jgi:outer membrane scaffolding protein for murein synthesis (MipA/OmpV family)
MTSATSDDRAVESSAYGAVAFHDGGARAKQSGIRFYFTARDFIDAGRLGVKNGWAKALAMLSLSVPLVALAQSTVAEELLQVKSVEISYGLNQTNLSLLRGVVIDTRLEPTLDFKLESQRGFLSLQNGLGLWLTHTPALKSGVSINYMLGRHQSADLHYQGLGDRSGSFDLYAFAEWQPILEAVTLYVNGASTPSPVGRELAQAGMTLALPVWGHWSAFWDLNETWGNSTYWQTYYSPSAQPQGALNQPNSFSAQGGALYLAQTLGGVYSVNKTTDWILGVGTLQASAALMQSPLLGRRRQPSAMIVINQKLNSLW